MLLPEPVQRLAESEFGLGLYKPDSPKTLRAAVLEDRTIVGPAEGEGRLEWVSMIPISGVNDAPGACRFKVGVNTVIELHSRADTMPADVEYVPISADVFSAWRAGYRRSFRQ